MTHLIDTLAEFDIHHLSLSHVKCFTEDRAQWYARYILKEKLPVGPAAFRGSSVEDGLCELLSGADALTAATVTANAFRKRCEESGILLDDYKAKAEQKKLGAYLDNALVCAEDTGLKDYAVDEIQTQKQIGLDIQGLPVTKGFIDFTAEVPYELKTVGRMVKAPRLWDVQQVLIYMKALKVEMGYLLYASPTGNATYIVRDGSNELASQGIPSSISYYESSALAVAGFCDAYLSYCDQDVDAAIEAMRWACTPDPASYRWTSDETKAIAERIWKT
jgi:hypothetical protein